MSLYNLDLNSFFKKLKTVKIILSIFSINFIAFVSKIQSIKEQLKKKIPLIASRNFVCRMSNRKTKKKTFFKLSCIPVYNKQTFLQL